jgi:excisionase family DNA binding protein
MANEARTEKPAAPLGHTVKTTADALGMSLNGTYQAIAAGRIPSFRIGKSIRVPDWFFREKRGD